MKKSKIKKMAKQFVKLSYKKKIYFLRMIDGSYNKLPKKTDKEYEINCIAEGLLTYISTHAAVKMWWFFGDRYLENFEVVFCRWCNTRRDPSLAKYAKWNKNSIEKAISEDGRGFAEHKINGCLVHAVKLKKEVK